MGNEKYLNYYVEILTSTLTDCVVRNVSMQANAKISEDVIEDQSEKIEKLSVALKELEDVNRKLREGQTANENNIITDLKNKLAEKDRELTVSSNLVNELNTKYRDYDSVKNQVSHVDTFKAELIRAREEIARTRNENQANIDNLTKKYEEEKANLLKQNAEEKANLEKQIAELDAKIDYLQLSPAKRKKIDELNKGPSIVSVMQYDNISTATVDDNSIKDGGTF
jgi:chromosome segregation ATPase